MAVFSVIVPIYNIEDYLEECLSSLKDQSFRDFEVLCVIDGSTDSSLAIAKAFAKEDNRFRVLKKPNGGLSSARNFGLTHATGEFVAFVDGDDFVASNFLQVLNDTFSERRCQAVIFGGQVYPEEASTPWFRENLTPPSKTWSGRDINLVLSNFATPFVWRSAYSLAALRNLEITFDETLPFGEDLVFQMQVYPKLEVITTIPDHLYFYRQDRAGSLMDSRKEVTKRLKSHRLMLEKIFESWKASGFLEGQEQRCLEWSVPYLLRDAKSLSPEEQKEVFTEAASLWNQFIPQGCERAISFKKGITFRTDGAFYIELAAEAAVPFFRLEAKAYNNGLCLPVEAHPIGDKWILKVPWTNGSTLDICLQADGRHFDSERFTVNLQEVKWLSRINWRLNKSRCAAAISASELVSAATGKCTVIQRFDGINKTVWRAEYRWIGPIICQQDNSSIMESIKVLGPNGEPLDASVIFGELQEAPSPKEENKLSVSVITASSQASFIVSTGQSFDVVTEDRAQILRLEAENLMLSAENANQSDFDRWLQVQRQRNSRAASELSIEVDQQAAAVASIAPAFSVIIFNCEASPESLGQTIGSLEDQTYPSWESVAANSPFTHEAVMAAIAKAQGEYLCFIEAGDSLEPEALQLFNAYAQAPTKQKSPEVLYCDEICPTAYRAASTNNDQQNAENQGAQWAFCKSQLNVDLLYGFNWTGQLLAVHRTALPHKVSANSLEGWLYQCALAGLENNPEDSAELFAYVPHVLFNRHRAPHFENSNANYHRDEYKDILQAHLNKRGLRAKASWKEDANALQLSYDAAYPHPKVSVIIPSKDHSDLLSTCVTSLLNESSYKNLEVIVVANNCEDPSSLPAYNALAETYDALRIVHWEGPFNYSAIINFGASHATGEYLLLLNNDTQLIEPNSIEALLAPLSRPEVGLTGAKLLYQDGLIQHAGVEVGVWGAVVHMNQNHNQQAGGYLNRAILSGNFSALTGACQMVPKALFDQLGGYDETFAVGFNDIDFCYRVAEAGKLITFVPQALFYHYEFASRGREVGNPEKEARWEKELAQFKKRWPEPFESCDPFTSPNLLHDNTYWRLA